MNALETKHVAIQATPTATRTDATETRTDAGSPIAAPAAKA